MKALVYTQPGELQMQERPMPELVPGDVVLKIEAVGICGSDMHAWHGHDPRRLPGLACRAWYWGTSSSAPSRKAQRAASTWARAGPATRSSPAPSRE